MIEHNEIVVTKGCKSYTLTTSKQFDVGSKKHVWIDKYRGNGGAFEMAKLFDVIDKFYNMNF